jgi:hypothetical protein
VISLEINEVNFDYVKYYTSKGQLPNFLALIDRYKTYETISEKHYSYLEPWIQWPTVYTGRTYEEHGIFRLGDVVSKDCSQIWEELEKRALKVGAVSPMNAANRCKHPAFFVPDPWTNTTVSGGRRLQSLFDGIKSIVNANSSGNVKRSVLMRFALNAIPEMRIESFFQYVKLIALSVKYKWARAIVLDRLLTDIFIRAWIKHRPDYSSIFLNAGAHIQHHHLYESAAYDGNQRNPNWYSDAQTKGVDPVLIVYQAYDRILKDILTLPNARLMITTGLSQMANAKNIYQYRFIDHAAFLERIGVSDARISPRMSRDFLLEFDNSEKASAAEVVLKKLKFDQKPIIEIENRGQSLFCKICYYGEQSGLKNIDFGESVIDMSADVVLVSIENGIHQSKGYHFDTNYLNSENDNLEQIALNSIFSKTLSAFS